MSQKNNESKNKNDKTQNMSHYSNTHVTHVEFNFKTHPPTFNVVDNSILYQKYSNKRVEGVEQNKNNNNGYVVYPTLNENDQKKYDEYLKDLSNIFNQG